MKTRKTLFLAIGFLLGLAPAAMAELRCDLCRQEIRGNYFTYKSQTQTFNVCADCNRTRTRCAACQIPRNPRDLVRKKGEYICRDCVPLVKYCALCDHRIEGRYIEFQKSGAAYCQSCYQQYPKCEACKKPTLLQNLDRETGICFDCLRELPNCGACGAPIHGKFFRYEFSEDVFCPDCHANRPKCHTCGVPVGDRYWKFPDGREICDACNKRAVIDVKQVERIMAETERLVHRYVGIQALDPYELKVEALNNHSRESAEEAKHGGKTLTSPLFGSELGLYRRMNGKSEIFLLYGLPIEMIYETAAHEYAHAWQAEHCPPDQSLELREGFAQWVAAQILRVKGYKMALDKLEARRDNPYGTGYQRMKSVYLRSGRKGVIEYAKNAKR